jgi:hypothetical protein
MSQHHTSLPAGTPVQQQLQQQQQAAQALPQALRPPAQPGAAPLRHQQLAQAPVPLPIAQPAGPLPTPRPPQQLTTAKIQQVSAMPVCELVAGVWNVFKYVLQVGMHVSRMCDHSALSLQHLDENAAWIRAIIENNALGRVDQATQCVHECPPVEALLQCAWRMTACSSLFLGGHSGSDVVALQEYKLSETACFLGAGTSRSCKTASCTWHP